MGGSVYLASQYLRSHLATSATLVAAISLTAFLPFSLEVIVQSAKFHFRSRAESTPLLIGPKGGSLQLVLSSLYFDRSPDDVMEYREYLRVREQQLGATIPLHLRYSMDQRPIVGTTPDYFAFRSLVVGSGRRWNTLGECVIGSEVARRQGWSPGDRVPAGASPAFLLDHPPLRLRVVGVLQRTETPDDFAVFVSLSTAWILDGLGHGHAPNLDHGAPGAVLFTDITADNARNFHFHGKQSTFPISSLIVAPTDARSGTLLQGQYLSPTNPLQIVEPPVLLDGLLEKALAVRSYVFAAVAVLGLATTATICLVVGLSIRLRKQELDTMRKIGCSRRSLAMMLFAEAAALLIAAGAIVLTLTALATALGPSLVRAAFA